MHATKRTIINQFLALVKAGEVVLQVDVPEGKTLAVVGVAEPLHVAADGEFFDVPAAIIAVRAGRG